MRDRAEWDVAVVGGGPAGLAAASAAAAAGARTVVLERAEHPRYKTCGGGLLGVSRAAAAGQITVPVRDEIRSATMTLRGGQEFTRSHGEPVLTMVTREEFDAALLNRAAESGAVVRQRAQVRAIEQADGSATARLADGTAVTATVIIGADGSSGVAARHVGAEFGQVDLGLELEIAVPEAAGRPWAGRVLLDWGQIPGSYAWVFPKGDRLTVGVIAARGQGAATKAYLREFVARLGLAHREVLRDSGHLTRCRTDGSPLRRGHVLVAGDAAGLLEPWTREGISYALRSGAVAGEVAARAATSGDPAATASSLDEYGAAISATLVPDMHAGRMLLSAFTRHTSTVHKAMSTAMGWRAFVGMCRSELTLAELVARPAARLPLSLLSRLLLARLGAGDLRVNADVVQRASQNGQNDRARLGAVRFGGVVVMALTSRDRTNDEPYDKNYRSDAHYRLQALYRSLYMGSSVRRMIVGVQFDSGRGLPGSAAFTRYSPVMCPGCDPSRRDGPETRGQLLTTAGQTGRAVPG